MVELLSDEDVFQNDDNKSETSSYVSEDNRSEASSYVSSISEEKTPLTNRKRRNSKTTPRAAGIGYRRGTLEKKRTKPVSQEICPPGPNFLGNLSPPPSEICPPPPSLKQVMYDFLKLKIYYIFYKSCVYIR